jgi:hypothetical protein
MACIAHSNTATGCCSHDPANRGRRLLSAWQRIGHAAANTLTNTFSAEIIGRPRPLPRKDKMPLTTARLERHRHCCPR